MAAKEMDRLEQEMLKLKGEVTKPGVYFARP
jgi:hypothetical protein